MYYMMIYILDMILLLLLHLKPHKIKLTFDSFQTATFMVNVILVTYFFAKLYQT